MFKTCIAYALIAALAISAPISTVAANVKYYPPGATPQPIEVARMLAGPQFKAHLKMRGVQLIGGAPVMATELFAQPTSQPQPIMFAQASTPAAAPVLAPTSVSVTAATSVSSTSVVSTAPPAAAIAAPEATETQTFAVSVPFAFNSAKLQPEAFEALDNIAEGIKLVKLPGELVIEGHTDAKGGDAYNLKLSMRRAAAVKRYFAQHHGIAASKLKAVGKGRAEPLNSQNPFAPENRRVQFRLA
jgi:outer membrane protein OmpA-like peptidoglycan-associated protein